VLHFSLRKGELGQKYLAFVVLFDQIFFVLILLLLLLLLLLLVVVVVVVVIVVVSESRSSSIGIANGLRFGGMIQCSLVDIIIIS
jgi:hypothetical protein